MSITTDYAMALYETGGNRLEIAEELRTLAESVHRVPALGIVLRDASAKPKAERAAIIESALAGVSPLLIRLINTVIGEGNLDMLGEISRRYVQLLRQGAGISDVHIESAHTLSDDEVNGILASCNLSRESALLTVKTKPSHLGGMRVVINDTEHDFSLGGSLNRLENQLIHGGV
jgi:F0F1-type ATP synthase delta subunit